MSKKPPPQVLFNFKENDTDQIVQENVNPETGEENPNFIHSDDEIMHEEPIKIQEKEKIVEKDIFNDYPDNLAVMPDEVKEELMEQGIKPQPEKPVKPLKEKKKRKPMSEEHKAKLALAREKAMIARKAKAEEKKKMKELEKQEKELLKKQKFKKVQKLKEEVEEEIEPAPAKIIKNDYPTSTITKKDLEEAQLEAIMKYEALRKERKAKKKQEQLVENEKQKMLNNIQRATGTYKYRDGSNRFDGCY